MNSIFVIIFMFCFANLFCIEAEFPIDKFSAMVALSTLQSKASGEELSQIKACLEEVRRLPNDIPADHLLKLRGLRDDVLGLLPKSKS